MERIISSCQIHGLEIQFRSGEIGAGAGAYGSTVSLHQGSGYRTTGKADLTTSGQACQWIRVTDIPLEVGQGRGSYYQI